MLDQDLAKLKALATKASRGGQHIYNNPRDDDNWQNNENYIVAAYPAHVIELIDRLQAAEYHEKCFIDYITAAAIKTKIYRSDVVLDGPQCLMAVDDMANYVIHLEAKLAELHKQPVAHYLRFESDGKATVWPTQVADFEPYYAGPVVAEQNPYDYVVECNGKRTLMRTQYEAEHMAHGIRETSGREVCVKPLYLHAKPVPAEQVRNEIEVTDYMALAFHHALTDADIGDGDVNEIKIGLRAAISHLSAPQPAQAVAIPEGYSLVNTNTLNCLLGEYGEFECYNHKHAWRKMLRDAIAAPVNGEGKL